MMIIQKVLAQSPWDKHPNVYAIGERMHVGNNSVLITDIELMPTGGVLIQAGGILKVLANLPMEIDVIMKEDPPNVGEEGFDADGDEEHKARKRRQKTGE